MACDCTRFIARPTQTPAWVVGVRGALRLCAAGVVAGGMLATAEVVSVAVGLTAASSQAVAQDDRYPFLNRRNQARRPPPPPQPRMQLFGGQSPFGGLFGPPPPPTRYYDPFRNPFHDQQQQQQQDARPQRPQAPVDSSRAPAAAKRDVEATANILVFGDSMADWLAYGLEDAFADTPEFGITRRHRTNSSLIRTEGRDAYDWVQSIKDSLARDKADFVVMMIGLGDRHPIRERPAAARPATSPGQKPGEAAKPEAAKPGDTAKPDDPAKQADAESAEAVPGQPSIITPEPIKPGALVSHEFRSEKWIELYGKRLDETIAALKAKRVPVLWVGLPPVRGPRARSEMVFLNEIFKERAAKAGILYVDVWDGFADESGEFSNFGPDIIGQNRRLRTGDGVHFTKFGARKLAHYAEREIKRLLERATPVALPIPAEPSPAETVLVPGAPRARPVAGPVMPLAGHAPTAEGLLGSASQAQPAADPVASKVLVRGEAVEATPGRADNFTWSPVNATAETAIEPPPADALAGAAGARPAAAPTRVTLPPRASQSAATPGRPVR